MSITEFKLPEWLEGITSDTIMKNMLANVPADIDKTEGGFVWDFLKPSALEKAEMVQFYLVQTLRLLHPMWATGKWLDVHAYENGLERKDATRSYGILKITGKAGTVIDKGFVFCVPSDGGVPAIPFETLNRVVIGENGVIEVEIQAVNGGVSSNVAEDTITIMQNPIKGIEIVTNEEATTGGTEIESDDDLRQRIDYYLAGNTISFVGNNADYRRWAEEVAGVGFAYVIPEYNGPNSVKVVVVDANGYPANNLILQNVHRHIFGTDRKDIARLAPIGVMDFAVVAPTPVEVNLSFRLKLEDGYTKDSVLETLRKNLSKHYSEVALDTSTDECELKFYKVAAVISDTSGVNDIDDLLMNGSEENLIFGREEYPTTGTLEVTLYE